MCLSQVFSLAAFRKIISVIFLAVRKSQCWSCFSDTSVTLCKSVYLVNHLLNAGLLCCRANNNCWFSPLHLFTDAFWKTFPTSCCSKTGLLMATSDDVFSTFFPFRAMSSHLTASHSPQMTGAVLRLILPRIVKYIKMLFLINFHFC